MWPTGPGVGLYYRPAQSRPRHPLPAGKLPTRRFVLVTPDRRRLDCVSNPEQNVRRGRGPVVLTGGVCPNRSFPMPPLPSRLRVLVLSLVAGWSGWLNAAPVITQQPQATVIATSGHPATFSVQASGTGTLRWQWRSLGTPIIGATGPVLTLSMPAMADAGFYDVVLTDDTGTTTSRPCRLLVAPVGGYANTLQLDTSFAPLFEADGGSIAGLAVAADGAVYVSGSFNGIGGQARTNLARFTADLTLDPSFAPTVTGGYGALLAVQPDGKLIIGGDFSKVNGEVRSLVARLNRDGSLDAGFSPVIALTGSWPTVVTLAVQSDGKILIGGRFDSVGGLPRQNVARLNADGSCDVAFSVAVGPSSFVSRLALAGEKVLILGSFQTVAGVARKGLARVHSDGALDLAFVPDISCDYAYAVATGADGRVYVGASYTADDLSSHADIVRLAGDGTRDVSYRPGLGDVPKAIAPLPDGRVAVAWMDGFGEYAVLSANGTKDSSFVIPRGPAESGCAIAATPSNQVYVGGYSAKVGSVLQNGVVRYESNGAQGAVAAPSLCSASNPSVFAPVAGGKWLVGGAFNRVNGSSRPFLARLNADGTTDTSFDASATLTTKVTGLVVQGGGPIVVYGGVPGAITKLLPDGARDLSFDAGTGFGSGPSFVRGLPDGRIVAAGYLADYNGESIDTAVVALLPNGQRDPSFSLELRPSGFVTALEVEANGGIAVAGALSRHSFTGALNFVRLAGDGTFLYPVDVNQGLDSWPRALGTDALGRLLLGGDFYRVGDQDRPGFARLNEDGSLADGLTGSTGFSRSTWPMSFAAQTDGQVLVAGSFTSYNSQPCGPLARLKTDDTLDTGFSMEDPCRVAFPTPLFFSDDGGLLICGAAARNGVMRSGLIKFKSPVAPPTIVGGGAGARTSYGSWIMTAIIAEGPGPFSYQWYHGESGDTTNPIDGATTSKYTTPPLTAWVRLWVRVSNPGGFVDSWTSLIEVTGGTMTLAEWTEQMGAPGTDRVPVNQRGAMDAPAGDGVTNLMKFALGVPPKDSALANLPTPSTYIEVGQPPMLALVFAKNVKGQGIRYALEVSTDLATWDEVDSTTDSLGANPDGTELVRLRETVPPAGVVRRFARLKVVVTAP
ncbi:MAG: hypothetical protein IPL39_05655 [Opitutaceae bacterium]|nr:hypothetical protein [Opitutaceae bacterium]